MYTRPSRGEQRVDDRLAFAQRHDRRATGKLRRRVEGAARHLAHRITNDREVVSGRGYLSQSELPVTIGLGKTAKVDRITIKWPGKNGGEEVVTDVAINKTHHIKQGQARGQAVASK